MGKMGMIGKIEQRQSGVALSGLLIWIVILVMGGIFAMKLIPPYIENAEIKDIFNAIAHDPEMQNAPLKNIRESFDKRAMMNNITIIEASDLEINRDAGGLALEARYQVLLPLVGNITLVLDFNPTSAAN